MGSTTPFPPMCPPLSLTHLHFPAPIIHHFLLGSHLRLYMHGQSIKLHLFHLGWRDEDTNCH